MSKSAVPWKISYTDEESFYCVQSAQIRSFFWSVFSRIRTKYGPEKTPYLDTFHAVFLLQTLTIILIASWLTYLTPITNISTIFLRWIHPNTTTSPTKKENFSCRFYYLFSIISVMLLDSECYWRVKCWYNTEAYSEPC